MRPSLRLILALVAAASLSLAACGDDDGDSAGPDSGTDAPAGADIKIENSSFTVQGTVSQGDEVTVTNDDSFGHTVTMDDEGGFDVSVSGGETATFTADQEPGSYPFHCEIHPTMTGTLVVE